MAKLEYEYVYEDENGNPVAAPKEEPRPEEYEEAIVKIIEVACSEDQGRDEGTSATAPFAGDEEASAAATERRSWRLPVAIAVAACVLLLAGALGVLAFSPGNDGPEDPKAAAHDPEGAEPGVREVKRPATPEEKLAELSSAAPRTVRPTLEKLAGARGAERRANWKVAITGLGPDRDTGTRIRSAQLVARLAAKPGSRYMGPSDPNAIPPLVECLSSSNAELVRVSLTALGTLHLANPNLGIAARTRSKLRELLASPDPARAGDAVSLAPMFKDPSLAPEIIAAWERHRKVEKFQARCLSALGILAKMRLKDAAMKADPRKLKADPRKYERACWRSASTEVKKLAARLGTEPANWKAWWAGS
jgi:hypothetical protein